jgi:hypothetical protein
VVDLESAVVKPVEPLRNMRVWILMQLDTTNNLMLHLNTDRMVNYFTNEQEALNQQLLLRLKSQNWHVFELEIPV